MLVSKDAVPSLIQWKAGISVSTHGAACSQSSSLSLNNTMAVYAFHIITITFINKCISTHKRSTDNKLVGKVTLTEFVP